MKSRTQTESRIPVILSANSNWPVYSIFNPNEWANDSKPVILSCAAQFALLRFAAVELEKTFREAKQLCQSKFLELSKQWEKAPWDTDRCIYWVEVPEVHLYVQVFLATTKTFLDLLAQLVSTEGIVNKKVHGFHKRHSIVGGRFLDTLSAKAAEETAEVATGLRELVERHKTVWIDQIVKARDDLAHPERGMYQVVFQLEIQEADEELKRIRVLRPSVGERPFDEYAKEIITHAESFSREFLRILKAA
jgi:hypothetical protein